jgi:hypothetical protein
VRSTANAEQLAAFLRACTSAAALRLRPTQCPSAGATQTPKPSSP